MDQGFIELSTACTIKYPDRRNPKEEVVLRKNRHAPFNLTFRLTQENSQGGILHIARQTVREPGSYEMLATPVAVEISFAPENYEALKLLYLDGSKSPYALMNTDYELSLMPDDMKKLRRGYGIPDPVARPVVKPISRGYTPSRGGYSIF